MPRFGLSGSDRSAPLPEAGAAPDVPASLPRTRGAAAARAIRRDGSSRLASFRQEGSLKLLWPHGDGEDPLEAVLLNTAGGLTGGDRLDLHLSAGAGSWLRVSTQAAERIYRTVSGPAEMTVDLQVESGGRLDWLPQETILYDGGAIHRRLRLDLGSGARALLAEPVILGRRAMGERVRRAWFRDRWEVIREGHLVFADRLRIGEEDWPAAGAAAMLGDAGAWASLLLVAPEAEARLDPLRRLLPGRAGASLLREGVLFARLLAEDGFALRRSLIPALELLGNRALPKVWRL